MSASEHAVLRSRREALRTGWIVLLSLLTLLPLSVWKATLAPDDPTALVSAFFQAIRDKDLDRALAYTDVDVPVGEAAAFLHPDAVSDDWEVLDLAEDTSRYSWETVVRVTIGHPEGTAEGRYTVRRLGDELRIVDPLPAVVFANSPQLAIRVNDRVVEREPEPSMHPHSSQYHLLPGVYRFFGGEPVALLEPEESTPPVVQSPPPEPTPEQAAAVQTAVEDLIDACIEYELTDPPGCPFATDGSIDTMERERLEAITGPVWTVTEYPRTSVVPGVDMWGQPTLLVGFDGPGRLELSGMGTADREQWKEFTAACHFGGEELMVLLRGDTEVELAPLDVEGTDTCRGTT